MQFYLFFVTFFSVHLAPWHEETDSYGPFTSEKPILWTLSYDSYSKRKYSRDPVLGLVVFFVSFIIGVLAALCKYFICRKIENSQNISTTLHAPPTSIIPLSQDHIRQTTQNVPRTDHMIILGRVWQGTSFGSTDGAPQASEYIGDRPPGYSDVVLADFTQEEKIFPEVSAKLGETPPPNYTEDCFRRY